MYAVNIVSQVVYMAVSIALLAWAIPTYSPPYQGFGVPATLFPNLLAGLILILSCVNLLRILIRKTGKDKPNPLTKEVWIKFFLFMAVLVATFPLMNFIRDVSNYKVSGFMVGGFTVVSALQLLMGQRRPIVLLILSSGTVAVLYVAFWHGLRVFLP